jgi:hypothetical protein
VRARRVRIGVARSRKILGSGSVPADSFLIGDSPAVPIRLKDGQLQTVNCAVGDSHTVVLPLTPHLIVVLGPEDLVGDLTPGHVSLLNEAQLLAAKDYVYYPPRSSRSAAPSRGIVMTLRLVIILGHMTGPYPAMFAGAVPMKIKIMRSQTACWSRKRARS